MIKRLVRFYLSYLILPNLIFNLVMHFIYMGRAVINVDYLLLGGVASFLPQAAVILIFVAMLVLDIISAFSPAYHMGLHTMLASFKYAFKLNTWVTIPVTLVLLAVVTIIALVAVRISPPRRASARSTAIAAIIMIVIIYALDVGNNSNRYLLSSHSLAPFNVSSSSVLKTLMATGTNILDGDVIHKPTQLQATRSATDFILTPLAKGNHSLADGVENIVLVIVESMGVPKNDATNQMLLQPFMKSGIREKYYVHTGTELIGGGATTNAEFRDICGIKADYRTIKDYSMLKCLPGYLKSLGFDTLALHGFSRFIFDRYKWWPEVGFNRTVFAEDVHKNPGIKYCGSVHRGARDIDMANIVRDELLGKKDKGKKFILWVTLNTHIPLGKDCIDKFLINCEDDVSTSRYSEFCTWMNTLHSTNSAIVDIAMDPHLPPTIFIIVGDHSPAFLRRGIRDLFIEGRVTSIQLIPRSAPTP